MTLPTQLSLDHYWAQQWNLDVDKMPGTLPPELADVQRLFSSYSRKGIPRVSMKPSSKPTLQKKLSQWNKAQVEQQNRKLELMYWRSNQDPKIYALLEKAKLTGESRSRSRGRGSSRDGKKMGKYTSVDKFKMHPLDMVPMVYPDSMKQKVEPVIYQLAKEHEEIKKQHE